MSISVYVINGKDESFIQPTTVSYKILDSNEQEVYSLIMSMTFINPPPTFPAHSKTLFNSHVWNPENSNCISGNYTIEVSLEYGTSECEIVISETPTPTSSSTSSSTPSSSPLPTGTSPLPSHSTPNQHQHLITRPLLHLLQPVPAVHL